MKVDLGAGNDDVTFVSQGYDCFNAYELNLGDGANTVNLSDQCADSDGTDDRQRRGWARRSDRGLAGLHLQRRRR